MKTKANPVCRVCGVELNDENWHPSARKRNYHICKTCENKQRQQWRKMNPKKEKTYWTRGNRKRGERPFNENKRCSSYLGVYVAERVLSHVFKDVQRMPMNNHGYDFKCRYGYLVDVKSSCMNKNGTWDFNIKHNTIADYFLCLAFDSREDLNPQHIWLLPGSKFNHLMHTAIRPSTIDKWDAYQLDISKINECCNILKEA